MLILLLQQKIRFWVYFSNSKPWVCKVLSIILTLNLMQKKYWKNIDNFQTDDKKSDFEPPSWIDPPFLAILTIYEFGSRCWSKYKLIKTQCKNLVVNSRSYAPLILDAILDIRRHLEFDKITLLLCNMLNPNKILVQRSLHFLYHTYITRRIDKIEFGVAQ
jgi:hypothetical protein